MAKASPIQPAYSSGELSPLVKGRVDTERWKAATSLCENFIPLIQGPLQKRPGIKYIANVIDDSVSSRLIDFEFSTTQTYLLEFGNNVMRVYRDKGLVLTGTPGAITGATSDNPVVITSTGHSFSNGDSVFISGVGGMSSINNRIFTVANKTTDTFELSGVDGSSYPDYSSGGTAYEVYEIATPYGTADLDGLSWTQSADTLYIFHEDYQPRTLTRTSHTSWTFDTFDMEDGPYLANNVTSTSLTPSGTGHLTPLMTSNSAPSGVAASTTSTNAFKLFNRDINNTPSSVSGTASGFASYDLGSGNSAIIDGYALTAHINQVAHNDMCTQWYVQGSDDGSTWLTLDARDNETGWASSETRYFSFENSVPYRYHRISFSGGGGSDSLNTKFSELAFHQKASDQTPFNLTASSTTGINDGDGFQSTDVGRTIRLKGADGAWRWGTIAARTSANVVTITLHGRPLIDTSPITNWKLGRYSGTTGWPTCGGFFEDRLVIGGPSPEYYTSETGDYTSFSTTEEDGTVVATNGVSVPNLLSRKVNAVKWLVADSRSLLLGTSGAEWVIKSADSTQAFSSTNIKSKPATFRGSSSIAPIQVENATLFMSPDGRALHELAYVFEADGYKAPNMTWLAEHVTSGTSVTGLAHAKSPQSIIWAIRADGQLLGFTYEREQNTLAWHRHPLAGGSLLAERIAAISGSDNTTDVYLVVKKGTQRFICVMDPLWTGSSVLDDAFFVDAGLAYDGSSTTTIGNLYYLEGETVEGTADGEKFSATVSNGEITLASAAEKVSVGLPYTSKASTMPLNAGATDGTSQGKTKRIHQVVFRVLNSRGGKYAHDANATTYAFNMTQSISKNFTTTNNLTTGDIIVRWPAEYDYDGEVYIEHDEPYPFTLIAHMPQVVTQDRG